MRRQCRQPSPGRQGMRWRRWWRRSGTPSATSAAATPAAPVPHSRCASGRRRLLAPHRNGRQQAPLHFVALPMTLQPHPSSAAASLRPMLCTLLLCCVDQVIGCLQAPEGGTSVPGAPRSILKRHSSARTPSPMPVKAPAPVPPSAARPPSPSRPGALPTTSPAIASSAAPPSSPLACNLPAAASPEVQTQGSHSRSPATPPALNTEIAAADASTIPSCRFLSTDSSPLKKSQQAAQVLAQKQVLPLPLARRAGSARAQAFLQASLGSPIKRQRVAV